MTNPYLHCASLTLLGVATCFGQSGLPPRFEVASVKPSQPASANAISRVAGVPATGARVDPALVSFTRTTLKSLIMQAYGLDGFQISGPEWIGGPVFYDIVAKMPEGSSSGMIPQMLKALLVERFKLASHIVTKETPVLVLSNDPAGSNSRLAAADGAMKYSVRTIRSCGSDLSKALDRPVLNQTGMDGSYLVPTEVSGLWLKRIVLPAITLPPELVGKVDLPSDDEIFKSVRSIGLQLEARRVPVDTLIIDHVEQTPTEN